MRIIGQIGKEFWPIVMLLSLHFFILNANVRRSTLSIVWILISKNANARILGVPLHSLHSTYCKPSPYSADKLTVD
jgi:hypothetical protein